MSDISILMDMGFSKEKSEEALEVTGSKGVEQAMEWLLAHANEIEPNTDEAQASAETTEAVDASTPGGQLATLGEDNSVDVRSIKCDECNKRFREDSEVEFHAVKTGHQRFSESSEEIKPLTEEEKQERVKKMEHLIKQRRIEKAEQEKKEELEKEKTRRKTGQEMTNIRQKIQEEEIKRLAELKRKEKLEAKLAKQSILEEIERDKIARRERFNMGGAPAPPAASTPAEVVPPTVSADSFDHCKLQIRLTDGTCLTQNFGPNEQLAAVRLYVELNRTDGNAPFTFLTNFPKRLFSEEDMEVSLVRLGLVPSAVLILTKPR